MIQQQVYIINTILMVTDALCIILSGYGAFFIKYYISPRYQGYYWTMETSVFVGAVLVVMFVNNYIMGAVDLYSDKRPVSYLDMGFKIFQALTIDFIVLATAVFILKIEAFSRLFLGLFAVFSFVSIFFSRYFIYLYLRHRASKGFSIQSILLVADNPRAQAVEKILGSQISWGHEIVGRVTIKEKEGDSLGSIYEIGRILQTHAIDEVIFALESNDRIDLAKAIEICRKIGVTVKILPSLWSEGEAPIGVEMYQGVPFLKIMPNRFNAGGIVYKRLLDITGGLVGCFILFILYPFIAAAIKLDSEGPVFFKQKRVGRRGRIFYLYKFRTMYHDAENMKEWLLGKNIMKGAMFKIEDDPRVTRVGKWLRKTSLDELPQMINVLKGEMSLVGTRPPTLDEVARYRMKDLRRISAKPGITGLWQISGRNKIVDFEKVVELDTKYLDEWSFFYDIKILLKTIIVLLSRKGAM